MQATPPVCDTDEKKTVEDVLMIARYLSLLSRSRNPCFDERARSQGSRSSSSWHELASQGKS